MVEIKVNGQIYGGWKTANISFGIEQIANSFNLSVTDRWAGQDVAYPIKTGAQCQVLVDGDLVITGHVDDVSPEFDANSHSITVAGRDATGDLVDCSAMHKTGQWANASLDKILRDICAPFGIKVLVQAPLGNKFPTYSIQEGESAHECIDRACRMRAVMPVSDGKGNLVITRASSDKPVAALIQGENILYARGDFSQLERFSIYYIKGQDRGSDDNTDDATIHSQVMASVSDEFIKRYRPLIVLAEDKGAHASYKERAEWERNVRRGRGTRASVRVNGWRNASGDLWRANTLVHLKCPYLGADVTLLVAGGAYILDESQGQVTELQLVGRSTFDLVAGLKATRLKSAIKGKDGASVSTSDSSRRKKTNTDDWSGEL
jgi:prophage tail gpP-like protein